MTSTLLNPDFGEAGWPASNLMQAVHHQVLIIGGGTAGLTVGTRLHRAEKRLDLAIVEPFDKHYYQPLWTLAGAGIFPKEASQRAEADYIPKGVSWLRDAVAECLPRENAVRTRDGRTISYDFLVVAPGIQINWGQVKGLEEAIGKGGVCSNYSYQYVDYTWGCIRDFKGGNALFTMPNTAVKCGGAPQKIMYLADDHFRRAGVRERSRVVFASASPKIFTVAKFADALDKVLTRKGIETRFRHNLTEIRADTREAVFEDLDTHETVVQPYDMIHVTPPQSAPDFVRNSPLANEAGWVDVDKSTLQHVRYPKRLQPGRRQQLTHLKDRFGSARSGPCRGREPPRPDSAGSARCSLRRLHGMPDPYGVRQIDPGGVRLRSQPQGDVPLRPGEGALEHVAAEEVRHPLDVLEPDAARPDVTFLLLTDQSA